MASKFIPLSNTFFDSKLFSLEKSSCLVLYLYCIKRANFSKNGRFDKGEFAEEYETIANKLGCSTKMIGRYMGDLISMGYIKRTGKCRYLVIGYEKMTDMSVSSSSKGSSEASSSINNTKAIEKDDEGWIQY